MEVRRGTMNKIKFVCMVGIMTALYFTLSSTIKVPIVGHISLDLGYLVLTCAAVCFGGVAAMIVGAGGCALESILLTPLGFSVSWLVMNLIVGAVTGFIIVRIKKHRWIAVPVILIGVALGVIAKTGIECWLYSIPVAVKIPKAATAFAIDSGVMIAGLPLAYYLKSKVMTRV